MPANPAAKKSAARAKAAKRASSKPAAEPVRTGAAKPREAPRRKQRTVPQAIGAALPVDLVQHFGDELVAMTREALPPGATARDLYRLLIEAKRLGADPVRGDVFLKRDLSRDGAATEYSVVAKLDPLLRFVEGSRGYRGHDEAALYITDEFQHGEVIGDGATLRERAGIRHVAGAPWDRGELWGAWCAVEFEGRPPVVRIVAAADYLPPAAEREQLDPEDPRRRHPDACMIAAAMSLALRRSTGLNDVVGADELPPGEPAREPRPEAPAATASSDRLESPLDAKDRAVLGAFARATRNTPGLWPRAKVRALLLACQDDDARDELAARIFDTTSEAIAKRLDELRRFDPSTLDGEERRTYDEEVGRLTAELPGQENAPQAA